MKAYKSIGVILAVTLLVAGLALGYLVWPRSEPESSTTLRVGLYQNKPKIYSDPAGNPAGLFVELLNEMAASEGWTIDYVACQWAECLMAVREGELDLMPDVAFSAPRDEYLDFHATAVAQSWSQFYRRRFEPIRSWNDLQNKRIAVLRDSVQERAIDRRLGEQSIPYQPILVDSMDAAFRAVDQQRADVAVTNTFFGRRHAPTYNLVETPLTFNTVGLYFAAAEGHHSELLQRIDTHLNRWKADPGSIYYDATERATTLPVEQVIPPWVRHTMIIVSGVLVALVFLVSALRWLVKQRTKQLEASNHRLHHLLNGSPAIIYSMRAYDHMPLWVSGNIKRIFGFTQSQALSAGWWRRQLHPDDRVSALRLNEHVIQRGHVSHEYRIFDARGKIRYIRDDKQFLSGKEDGHDEIIGSWTDLTESYEQKAQLAYLTHYDPLTGLPNRLLIHHRISEALETVDGKTESVYLICLDFDRFKNVNDSLGTEAGDQVLNLVTERLREWVTRRDTLSRTGPDEFCILVSRPLSPQELETKLRKLITRLQKPLKVADTSLILTASVGVSRFPNDGETAEQLMTSAELAMFAAKRRGGDCWRHYHPTLSKVTEEKFLLENALRHAVANQELLLLFQPQYDLQHHALSGIEALVRWQHPERGLISPGQFIPLAEEIGIIGDIDVWVLRRACEQLQRWDQQGFYVPRVAVNVSAATLQSDTIVDTVTTVLQDRQLQPERLELEVTESMLTCTPGSAVARLDRLAERGVNLAMDDFGTGYSNLASLSGLPIHRLKIDQTFVRDIGNSSHNESIIRAIIALATALELDIVAEGIEQPQQQEFLLKAGCNEGQGFLLGHPMPADQLHQSQKGRSVAPINSRRSSA